MLVSSVQKRHGHTGVSPCKDHKDGEWTGATVLTDEEGKAQGNITDIYEYLMEVNKEDADRQWCSVTRKEAMGTNENYIALQ